MKRYVIYFYELGSLHLNTVNLLRGASMALAATGFRLEVTFANSKSITFSTNCLSFVERLRADLYNYGLRIESHN